MFQQLLHEENILLGLNADNQRDALRDIVESIPAWAANAVQKQDILDLLLVREKFGTTAMGDGLAFPHCYVRGLRHPIAVLGIHRSGVDYNALDGSPVHLIFMLILPEEEAARQEKRKIMLTMQSVLSDAFLRERIKMASTSEEALEWLLREETLTYPGLQVV